MKLHKRSREIGELAAKYGFELHRCSTHLVWRHTKSGQKVVTPWSPSDGARGLKNCESQFRKTATACA